MKQNGKGVGPKKLLGKGQKEAVHHRSKYVDETLKFVEKINSLGIEKTYFGRLFQVLEDRFKVRRFSLLFVFSILIAFFLNFELDFSYTGYREGNVATTDIRSPISFEMVDEYSTATQKVAAEDSVPPVFDYYRDVYEDRLSQVYEAFRIMRRQLPRAWPRNQERREEAVKNFLAYKGQFRNSLGNMPISNRLFEWLTENRFSVRYENIVIRMLENYSSYMIVPNKQPLNQMGRDQIIVRNIDRQASSDEYTLKLDKITDVPTMRKRINITSDRMSDRDKKNIAFLISKLIIPNLTLNQKETSVRRQRARESVVEVIANIKKGQVIVGEGAVIQSSHVRILDEISRRKASHRRDFVSLFLAALFVSMILVFFSYLRRFTLNRVMVSSKDLVVMGLIALLMVAISKFTYFISIEAIRERVSMLIPESAFLYLIPASAGPIIVGLLIYSGEVVWLFVLFLSAVLSVMVGFNFEFLIFSVIGGIAGARGVHGFKKRSDIYWAGIRVGLINMLVVALLTISVKFQTDTGLWSLVLWNSLAAFASGIFSCLIAMMLVPLFESAFNYTTDLKLLELGNLNHPLLREMIVKAPGTYHHSLVVGNMVEAAAEAIGANPLLAKVSSYYHDIGKTEHAAYFIENQKPGNNPHDHLKPHMSKTILVAHVKDGAELGMKHKLGKPIIDVIVQHHGTTLISFFYNRAKDEEDVEIDEISEEDFRYPGPKPQFREAALCMLADSIEAAARSLDEPNPMRLRNIVKNIIHRKFMDGQLDECNLNLRDLSAIENSFYSILLGIYHQRIDYPKNAGGGAADAPEAPKAKGSLRPV